MKFIVSITTVLFVLLTSSVSWGSIDGKGIVCEDEYENKENYFFNDTSVTSYYFQLSFNEKIEIEKNYNRKYGFNENRIDWVFDKFFISLNRQTLKLTITDTNIDKKFYDCDVYSKSKFFQNLEKTKKQYQSEYDEKTKKNKI